jgi:uroporphyrinogen-III synthase
VNSYNGDLSNTWVVVTRPAHQADSVSKRIEQSGGQVIRFPVIEIEAPVNIARLHTVLRRFPDFDWLVFVSVNAVHMGLQAIANAGVPQHNAKIAAVGVRTARTLQQKGWDVDVVAKPPYNSEALLTEPLMQRVKGQRFLIFRGESGRELLRETLLTRGAQVDYAECYRRATARSDPALLDKAWSRQRLDVIMITSVAGIENLISILGHSNRSRLLRTSLVVAGQRVAQAAHDHGWLAPVVVAADATDDAMLVALHTWGNKRSLVKR